MKKKTQRARKGSEEDVLRFMQDDRLLIIYAAQAVRHEVIVYALLIIGSIFLYAVDLEGHWIMTVFERLLKWLGFAAMAFASFSLTLKSLRYERALTLARMFLEEVVDERSEVAETVKDAEAKDTP